MNALGAYCLVIASAFGIDIVARWALKRPGREHEIKPAGLYSLLVMCFLQGQRTYAQRSKVIKQFFLSLTIVALMAGANYFLATIGAPKNAEVLGFALLVTPILTMPFFHFLYGLIGIQPLFVDGLLVEFRIRGAIAVILSANVIFVAIEPLQHILGLFIHFCLAMFAVVGTFYLCAQQRRKALVYNAPFQNIEYGLEPMMLHYLAAILEVLYSIILIAEVFLRSVLEMWLGHDIDGLSFIASLLMLLTCIALFTKIRFVFGPVISVEFYEQRALPLSFLIFGLASIVRYYF